MKIRGKILIIIGFLLIATSWIFVSINNKNVKKNDNNDNKPTEKKIPVEKITYNKVTFEGKEFGIPSTFKYYFEVDETGKNTLWLQKDKLWKASVQVIPASDYVHITSEEQIDEFEKILTESGVTVRKNVVSNTNGEYVFGFKYWRLVGGVKYAFLLGYMNFDDENLYEIVIRNNEESFDYDALEEITQIFRRAN